MEKMLDESIQKQVKEVFAGMQNPVRIVFFGSEKQNCEYCQQTSDLLREVADLSPLITLDIYDLEEESALAERYHIDKVPGFAFLGQKDGQEIDYGVRFAGIPAGHEFSTLIHDLVLVANQDSGLSKETREFLQGLDQPVHLQVFVTPT